MRTYIVKSLAVAIFLATASSDASVFMAPHHMPTEGIERMRKW